MSLLTRHRIITEGKLENSSGSAGIPAPAVLQLMNPKPVKTHKSFVFYQEGGQVEAGLAGRLSDTCSSPVLSAHPEEPGKPESQLPRALKHRQQALHLEVITSLMPQETSENVWKIYSHTPNWKHSNPISREVDDMV